MGSRMRSERFERDYGRESRRYERSSRTDSYSYREDDRDDDSRKASSQLPFTTDINPDIFSGPLELEEGQSSSRYSGGYHDGRYDSPPRDSYYDRHGRDSYYDDDDRRSRRARYDRDRPRDRSRERDRSRARDRSHDSREEELRERERSYRDTREEMPNNTLMVRGLDNDITDTDIRNEVLRYGLEPKEIRVIREKYTGASRGFAFVEFSLLSEAVRWKELTKGSVLLNGTNRASLHYSIDKNLLAADKYWANKTDWDCPKCGMCNFKRRDYCFKCNCSRDDIVAEYNDWAQTAVSECYNEISNNPSNTLLFGNLDVLTTEGRVLAMLGQLTTLPIKSLRVAKDNVTNTSRGYAFVELNSTNEAIQLHELLSSMAGSFFVDGRPVTVMYAKRSIITRNSTGNPAASVALAAAQWTNKKDDSPQTNSGSDAAPKTDGMHRNYSAADKIVSNLGTVIINGATYYKYNQPDISTYQYDESSGYYYDATTGLYYDANSQYYYNSETQQYLYWDSQNQTYLPVAATPEASTVASNASATQQAAAQAETDDTEKKKGKEEKADKVKIAKKIAKDMEKWAKTLNQKKENAKLGIVSAPAGNAMPNMVANYEFLKSSATADAGFAILEKRTSLAERSALMAELDNSINVLSSAAKPTLVSYGDDTDSEPEESDQSGGKKSGNRIDDGKFIDLSKMACLLCKRQFPNKEALTRHQQLSDLHKKNLAKMTGS